MLTWIAIALCSTSLLLLAWREVGYGMQLRRLGRLRPSSPTLVRLGFDLQDRLMRGIR